MPARRALQSAQDAHQHSSHGQSGESSVHVTGAMPRMPETEYRKLTRRIAALAGKRSVTYTAFSVILAEMEQANDDNDQECIADTR